MSIIDQLETLSDPQPEPWPLVTKLSDFKPFPLNDKCRVLVGRLPPLEIDFQALWDTHPPHFNRIKMYAKEVYIPRWQQAYGRDYAFSGQVNEAMVITPEMVPFLEWARHLHPDLGILNGLLLNWYDPEMGHYIGRHRDSETGLVPGSPIITISLGGERLFRMKPHGATVPKIDIPVSDGDIVVIPWKTNKAWTHEVPKLTRFTERRISITVRAFT